MAKVFDRGDIVRLRLDPTEGEEIQGDNRPCLVLSKHKLNKLGTTLIAPITQGIHNRYAGFSVNLMGSGTMTQGVVSLAMARFVDVNRRNPSFVETLAPSYVDECLDRFAAIIEE